MSKSREELRRGLKALIRDTSRQMRDLEDNASPAEGPNKPLLPDPQTLARRSEAAADEDEGDRAPAPSAPLPAAPPESAVQLDVLGPEAPSREATAASGRAIDPEARPRRKVAYLPGVEPMAAPAASPVAEAAPAPPSPVAPPDEPAAPTQPGEPPALDEARERLLRAELEDLAHYDERRGVCFAFFLNRNCWEVDDAFCNHALHVCMLRNCPVYHLHRETLEKRFAAKFKHFW